MLKKTIKYTDFNGEQREEDFYFNLTQAELIDMDLSEAGGLQEMLRRIVNLRDTSKIITLFKEIILKSVGVKSPDGRKFIKNQEIRDDFAQTQAFSDLYLELISNVDSAIQFVTGIVPADLAEQAKTRYDEATAKGESPLSIVTSNN